MHKELREEIIKGIDFSQSLSGEQIKEMLDSRIGQLSKTRAIPISDREKIKNDIFNRIRKLGILQELIEDSEITEIMVNGSDNIFVEKHGKIERIDVSFDSTENLKQIIWQIVADCNRVINEANPIVDARLSDGSRVNVVLDPIALNGPILTIRKFPQNPISMDDLISCGSITKECADFLKQLVVAGYNIIVSGGTGSGKTTFLNVLGDFIPKSQRVITIEDSAELQIKGVPNLVSMETRNANVEGCRMITIRDLIKTSLRMRPDRLIVGEVRGNETIDMLQAINTGHISMTTVHANSVRDVVSRLESMVLMGVDMPLLAIRSQICAGFDLMIHLKRWQDGTRRVAEIAEPMEILDGNIKIRTLYRINDKNGKLEKVNELKNTEKLI